MIWSTEWVRWSRGFMCANTMPELMPICPGTKTPTSCDFRVARASTSPTAWVCAAMESNDMSCGPSVAREHEAAVLARNEAGRHRAEQVHGAEQHRDRDRQGHQPEAQGDAQRALVPARQHVEAALQGAVQNAVPHAVVRLQEAAAEHRREAERHEAGDQNRHHDGHGELVQQASHDAAQEQHRDEDRHQRDGHRENREADFARRREARRTCGVSPISMWRTMFSSITMASSTTKPTESVSAISERLFRL